ncbi:MAG: PorP/SprF family type IX secretion system membrane protein [Saprospiraceae bacterium]|nr:MAG: Bacteroidetes-specific putative membrane protein [Bacteroidetes bacterium OLB9]MCO6463284.1 PorP/SprF family type IX secretion system membrane protein [Saprospiraceae bacterium]
MKTKNKYIFGIILLFVSMNVAGQQLPNSSMLSETRTIWNPAYTANENNMIIDAFARTQWLGFSGAPATGFAGVQYPFVTYNMSAGGLIHYDKTGPVSKIGLQLNYAYKLRQVLSRYGQLSLGIGADFEQYSFNGSGEVFNDLDDILINNARASSFFPSLSAGFFYTSNIRPYRGNSFFVGAAMSQVFTTEVLVNDFNQVRQKHYHFNLGGKIYYYDSYFEPMITANLVQPDLIDVLYSVKYEMRDAFWAGVGFSGGGMAAVQGGVILSDLGENDAVMKIGVLGSYGLSAKLAKTGPGFEVYIGYYLEQDHR